MARKLEDAAQHNNLGEVFWILWQAKTGPRSINYLIKNLNGDVLTTEAECLDCWEKNFQLLLNHPTPQGNDDLPNKPASNDYTDTCIQPVTKAELAAALKHLKMATTLVSVSSWLSFLRCWWGKPYPLACMYY